MNIFSKITLRNLQKNKTRTLVTIIGIILSAAMFTAVTSTITSVKQFLIDFYAYEDGSWHICYYNMSISDLTQLENEDQVDHLDTLQRIGYSPLQDCANEYKPYLYVAAISQDFSDTMPVHLLEGRMPETSEEIILPEHLDYNGQIIYHIGDKLNLDLFNRVSGDYILGNGTPFNGEETLSPIGSATYTVVGFYERPSFEDFSAPGYTALTISDSTVGQDCYDTYVTLTNLYLAEDFYTSHDFPDSATMNSSYLRLFSASAESSYNRVLYSLAIILMAIIMFGSVSLIYNSFAISVNERSRQFGILSSIGATGKQLRRSVLTEGLFLSIIGIPLGILAGLLGMYVTFSILGKQITDSLLDTTTIAVSLHPSLSGILLTIAITLITVLISAYIPGKRAMRCTAIESIRQSDTIKLTSRQIRVPPVTGRLFGFSGLLATKNYKRNKSKYRATVFSLFISIVLFISTSSFCAYLIKSTDIVYDETQYDMCIDIFSDGTNSLDIEEMLAEVESMDSVTQCLLSSEYWGDLTLNSAELSPDYAQYMGYAAQEVPSGETSRECISIQVRFLEDHSFAEYLSELKEDPADYQIPGQPKAVLVNSAKLWDTDHYRLCETVKNVENADMVLRIGNEIPIACDRTVDAVPPLSRSSSFFPCLLLPMSQLEYFLPQDEMPSYAISLYTSDHKDASDKIYAYFDSIDTSIYLEDAVAAVESNRTFLMIIQVFCYGFIVLISLIAMANVFNTISTNVSLRRKEFAMLRSVGMDDRTFYRMMNYECLLYGCKGLLYGLPASILVTYLIYRAINDGLEMSFFIPWYSLVITILGVFLIVFATMLYSMKKLQKESVIEVLRNDNI